MRIALDLGTSTCLVACQEREGEHPYIVPIGEGGQRYLRSRAFFDKNTETLYVGEEAEQRSLSQNEDLLPSAKRYFKPRFMDTSTGLPIPTEFARARRDAGLHDDFPQWPHLSCKGQPLRPADVLLSLAEKSFERCSHHLALTDKAICPLHIGCTAAADKNLRDELVHIAHECRFLSVTPDHIIDEPALAAVGHWLSRGRLSEGNYIVYDFGGGTFDTAWVEYPGPDKPLRIIACTGDEWLGGDDIDHSILVGPLVGGVHRVTGIPLDDVKWFATNDEVLCRTWREQAEVVKRHLGNEAQVELDSTTLNLSRLPSVVASVQPVVITQKDIEPIFRDSCLRSHAALNRLACYRAAVQGKDGQVIERCLSDIAGVFLVGGISESPFVQGYLTNLFQGKPLIRADIFSPVEAVAFGGAYPKRDDTYQFISMARLPYNIAVGFADETGQQLGQPHVLFERSAEPFAWWQTHTGGSLSRKAECPVPERARGAYLIYQGQDGQWQREHTHTNIAVGRGEENMPQFLVYAHDKVTVAMTLDGRLEVSFKSSTGQEREGKTYVAMEPPWFSDQDKRDLENRIAEIRKQHRKETGERLDDTDPY